MMTIAVFGISVTLIIMATACHTFLFASDEHH